MPARQGDLRTSLQPLSAGPVPLASSVPQRREAHRALRVHQAATPAQAHSNSPLLALLLRTGRGKVADVSSAQPVTTTLMPTRQHLVTMTQRHALQPTEPTRTTPAMAASRTSAPPRPTTLPLAKRQLMALMVCVRGTIALVVTLDKFLALSVALRHVQIARVAFTLLKVPAHASNA